MEYQATVKTKIISAHGRPMTTIIEGADIFNVQLGGMRTSEQKCAECMGYFEPDDEVVVFQTSKFTVAETIPLGEPYLVHVKNSAGKVCLEDFISRVLQNHKQKEEEVSVPETKISVEEIPHQE